MNLPWFATSQDLIRGMDVAAQFLAGARPSAPYREMAGDKATADQIEPTVTDVMAPADHLKEVISAALQYAQRRNLDYRRASRGKLLRLGAQDYFARSTDQSDALDLAFLP